MLSIGKLSHLAQLHEGETEISQDVLDGMELSQYGVLYSSTHPPAAFHDGLDFVSVHDTLVEDLKSALATVRSRQSLEMQVETIAQQKAANLGASKAFYNVSTPYYLLLCVYAHREIRSSKTSSDSSCKGKRSLSKTWQMC